jgi:hypothetical protein
MPATRCSCIAPCKEQAGNREPSSAPFSYSRRLVLRSHKRSRAFGYPASPSPALMLRSRAAHASSRNAPPCARYATSRSMRAYSVARPHPSRRAHACSRWPHHLPCALLRMRTTRSRHPYSLVKQPISFPRRIFCARVFASLLRQAPIEGWRSAEKRSGAAAPVGHALTSHARRLARRLASHSASRRA